MNSGRNAFLRAVIGLFFFLVGLILQLKNTFDRKNYKTTWNRRKKQLLTGDELPQAFETQQERLLKLGGPDFFLAETSGTRSIPKKVPYSRERMQLTQKTFLKSMVTLTSHHSGHKTFFVFSSVTDESSLTSGMLKEKTPSLVELLQAPYRFFSTQEGKKLIQENGILSARLALIAVTSPRYFYATNPSTILHFLEEAERHWPNLRTQLAKLPDALWQLADGNARARIKRLTTLKRPTIQDFAPDLKAIITWDGGYVAPFLVRLKQKLPPIEFLPMYSMSTESIETLPHRINNDIHFLPLIPKALPEFLKDGVIYSPFELKIGETYTLLISDEWGLKRYDTQDEFEVEAMIEGLPDLRFKRRRSVTASMTGEKITEEQCLLLYQELKKRYELSEVFLSLFGRQNGQYQINLIGKTPKFCLVEFAQEADRILQELNSEYAAKIESKRLSQMKAESMSLDLFAELMGQKAKWESQFKVMPLYERPI